MSKHRQQLERAQKRFQNAARELRRLRLLLWRIARRSEEWTPSDVQAACALGLGIPYEEMRAEVEAWREENGKEVEDDE